jgi:hypothetical protein
MVHRSNLGECKEEREMPPPNIFIPRFLATDLKRGKCKMQIFSKRLFGWCKGIKMENVRFMGQLSL